MASFILGLLGAILLAAGACGAARRLLRARPGSGAGLEVAAIGAAAAAGLALLYQNVLVHDALWYYTYLRSALVDGDLDLYVEFTLKNPHGMYLPPPGTPVFHLGTGLLEAPLALLVRPLALALARAGVLPGGDGYGPLEVFAATFSSLLLAIGGVALCHRLARRYVRGAASAVAQVALLYASPLAFFAFVWPGYPHGASVFLAAVFLLVWVRAAPDRGAWWWFLLGLLGGVLALVHPQDIVYLALPGLDLLPWGRGAPIGAAGGRHGWRAAAPRCAALLSGAVLGFAPQAAAWLLTEGSLLPDVYGEIGDPFRFTRPALAPVMLSPCNGLLTWTPLCGLALCGIALLRRDHPRLFRGLAALVLLEWWAIASYGYWWGGASFGARYFLSAYPALAVGLAAVVARVARRIGLLRTGVLAAPFIYWNLLLMAQFRLEWIPHNQPPDFAAALGRQFTAAPAALVAGLSGAAGWNQVLFVETLRAAAESGRAAALAGWAIAAAGLAGALVVWVARLCGATSRPGAPGPAPAAASRAPALAVSAALLVATLVVAGAAAAHDGARVHARGAGLPARIAAASQATIRLARGPDDRDRANPTAVVLAAARAPSRPGRLRLDLLSFLHNGARREQGRTVARLRVDGPGCADLALPLRAGIETAETAPGRVEARDLMRHAPAPAAVAQTWWQHDLSSRHYFGHAYLASWPLPAGCDPWSISIRVAAGAGALEVRDLVIAAEEAGT